MPNLCTVCSSTSTQWKQKNGYYLRKCDVKACGHIFVSPTPTDEDLMHFYSSDTDSLENSGSWTLAHDLEVNPDAVRRHYERARTRLLKRDGLMGATSQRIVDVGSATGSFLRTLQMCGYSNLCGIEISQQQAEYCRNQYKIDVHRDYKQMPDNSVDLVTMYAVLEHVRDPKFVVAEAFRILVSGGNLAIDVPNIRSLYHSVARSHWLWLIPPAHLQYFTPRSLRRLLETAGFEVVKARTLSTSTYLFIVAYHLSQIFGWELPNTSIARGPRVASFIRVGESVIRLVLSPLDLVLRVINRHNQLVFFARKP